MDEQSGPLDQAIPDERRRMARVMAGMGAARRQIAKYLGVEEAVLAALLGEELDQAEMEANTKVAKALFTMATQKNNVAAAIFWMKARGGWREKQEIEATIKSETRQRFVISAAPEMSSDEWMATYAPKFIG